MDDSLMDEIASTSVNEDENNDYLYNEFYTPFDDLDETRFLTNTLLELESAIIDEFEGKDDDKDDVVLSSTLIHCTKDETRKVSLFTDICCICGVRKEKHAHINHGFFPCLEEYRCKRCSKFFYQHDHRKNPCFSPYKYIGK